MNETTRQNLLSLHFTEDSLEVFRLRMEDVEFTACEYLGQLAIGFLYVREREMGEGEVRIPLTATPLQIAQVIFRVCHPSPKGRSGAKP